MIHRIALLATATLLAAAVTRPAAAQTDWRMTLGILYALSYAIPACGVEATPEQMRKLERHINHAEGKVRMCPAEPRDIRPTRRDRGAQGHQAHV